MAGLDETIFFVQMFLFMGLFLYRVYNVIQGGVLYEWKEGIMFLVISSLIYGIGFITSILNYDNNLVIQLMKLETPLFIATFVLFFIELMITLNTAAQNNIKTSYNAKKFYAGK